MAGCRRTWGIFMACSLNLFRRFSLWRLRIPQRKISAWQWKNIDLFNSGDRFCAGLSQKATGFRGLDIRNRLEIQK
jgi:hypothetical protein